MGVVQDQRIVDLRDAGLGFESLEAIIHAGQEGLDKIKAAVAGAAASVDLAGVRLLSPSTRPGKFLAIGMNYRKHAEESERIGVATPTKQLWFNKQITCLSGPFDDIDPGVTEKLDYEVELGVVIGKRTKSATPENALSSVFGYFVANDVSARDWQFHTPTFTMGKSFDTHGPIGPWVVTADEIPDPQQLDLRCWVNGELRQASNTREMVHSIADQISYLSTAFTLEPGDLIATGTPEGVGVALNPPVFLQRGDVVRCEVEKIGVIENKVA